MKLAIKNSLGSSLAILAGLALIMGGIGQPGNSLVAGPVMIIGALAYRSARERQNNPATDTTLRHSIELLGISLIVFSVIMSNNLQRRAIEDPVPILIVPAWAIITYIVAVLKPRNQR